MPTYDYICESCGNITEEIQKISERFKPTESPCKKCGGKVKYKYGSPLVCDAVALGVKKPNSDFSEVMSNIKKAHPLGTIKDY